MTQRVLLLLVLVAAARLPAAGQSPSHDDFAQDFDFAWRSIGSTYAYFEDKGISWDRVPALYADDLARVRTRDEFIALLEHVLDELYDAHAQLTVNTAVSPRLVPSGTDLWAEWRDQQAVISQVRMDSDAARAGLKPFDVVISMNGRPIRDAVELRMGRSYPHSIPAARDWALRAVLAGHHNERRLLQVQQGATRRALELPGTDQLKATDALVTSSEIRAGVGYIRLNDSLGTRGVVAAFDRALENLRDTRMLILDLRNTPSGGHTPLARGILGRFVRSELPYQKHVLMSEEKMTGIRRSWLELVSPREGLSYRKPVAVLVGRWTGSMGEGLAIGFDATDTATVVGTAMAGLMGATYSVTLPRTGIGMNVPAERLYHVKGTPREAFQPKVPVDVGAPTDRDPFIAAALRTLGEP